MSGPTVYVVTVEPSIAILSYCGIMAARSIRLGQMRATAINANAHCAAEEIRKSVQSAGKDACSRARKAALEDLAAIRGLAGICQTLRVSGEPVAIPAEPGESLGLEELCSYAAALQSMRRDIEFALNAWTVANGCSDSAQTLLIRRSADELEGLGELKKSEELRAKAQAICSMPAGARLLSRAAELLADEPALLSAMEQKAREIDDPATAEQRRGLLHDQARLELFEAAKRKAEQASAQMSAIIMEETLKDLGYMVDGVSSTLFVEGGVAHLAQSGWGEHMVRMRVDPANSRLNFNVVRAVDPADPGSRAIRAEDALAEDRWCSCQPKLEAALASRGIALSAARRLKAGEAPVLLADKDKLPDFSARDAEQNQSTQSAAEPLKSMELPHDGQ